MNRSARNYLVNRNAAFKASLALFAGCAVGACVSWAVSSTWAPDSQSATALQRLPQQLGSPLPSDSAAESLPQQDGVVFAGAGQDGIVASPCPAIASGMRLTFAHPFQSVAGSSSSLVDLSIRLQI
jgi:hypothetical protein